MKANDLRVTENGERIRILLQMDSESYVVDCQHFRMPYAVSQKQLAETEPLQTEDYTVFVLDEDVSAAQRKERDRRLALIQPLMTDVCIYDKHHRNELLRGIIAQNSVNRRTVLLYLWRYWVYQSKNALLPQERPPKEARALSADEKIFRWALNKFFYTPQRQSLQTAYKMMLQTKYCDVRGRLLPQRPTFWQFRYFYRQHRDPINETISRQGIKAYQRNYRPITGSVSDYATTIGTFMTDATVADIYIVSRLSRKPIGRPVIYTMVDAYSRLITGVYVGLEGGQYALRLLLQNTVADKVTYPYYARFFPASRKQAAYGYVQSGDPRAVHRLGIYQSGITHHVMRYCPDCLAEDITQYGEPYWHRLHQLPDMQICPKHHRWLVNTDVSDESSRQLTLCLPTLQMQLAASPNAPIPEPLPALNTAMQDTLTTPFNMANGDTYRAMFDQRLRDCGWRSLTGGRTYANKIESALSSFYGSSISVDDISAKQLHATLSQKNVSTRHVLELATFWGLSLHDLLSLPAKPCNYKTEMQEMYAAGTSMYMIAKLYGVDSKTVARWVK